MSDFESKASAAGLICIEDRKMAIAYAVEALRLFDHFHFRSKLQPSEDPASLGLVRP